MKLGGPDTVPIRIGEPSLDQIKSKLTPWALQCGHMLTGFWSNPRQLCFRINDRSFRMPARACSSFLPTPHFQNAGIM